MKFTLCRCPSLLVALICCSTLRAESVRFELKIDAGDRARQDLPVTVDVAVPAALKDATAASIKLPDGKQIEGQLTAPRLLSEPIELAENEVHRQLNFILDKLDAGAALTVEATISDDAAKSAAGFAWTDVEGKHSDLSYAGRPLLRYMYEPLDESSKARREETYKVYHHVFDPSGQRLVTKGAGGLFPHHRGLFFGFNRVKYDGNKGADTWHCTGKAHQSHDGLVSSEAGPVLGRHVVEVGWHGQEGETFAHEQREMTVHRQPEADGKPAGTLIEFASVLETEGGDIELKGDPQHAGFQFRASQEVPDKTAKQTYYVRPDGVDKPGKFRNWPNQKDQVNLPWKGLSFVLGDQRYTVAYLDRPENPKESRFSEGDYGRFGSYFEYTVTKDQPLKLNYRIWLQPGEMSVEQIDAMAKDFTDPPAVSVRRL